MKLTFTQLMLHAVLAQLCTLQTSAADDVINYCNEAGEVLLSGSTPFVVQTASNSSKLITSYMNCQFRTKPLKQAGKYQYYVEVLGVQVENDMSFLEVVDIPDGTRLLHESNLDWSRQVFVSKTDEIRIEFSTEAYPSEAIHTGYRIRLTPFKSNSCPPGWSKRGGKYCFSNSSSQFLGDASGVAMPHPKADFDTAQAVCNHLRANLLVASDDVLASAKISSLDQLALVLKFKEPLWIGLTDKTDDRGQGRFYWLSRIEQSQLNSDWLSCRSNHDWPHPQACLSSERFALLRPTRTAFLVMEERSANHSFACFAPINGTDLFYPTELTAATSSGSSALQILVLILASLFCIILIVILIYKVVGYGDRIRVRNARPRVVCNNDPNIPGESTPLRQDVDSHA